jgi:glycosyltransferase involved in cell wall biosynthesis
MISIIIPTLNEKENLKGLLEDIRNQSFRDYEVIIVDAYSKDRTREIAKKYGCRTISDRSKPGKARNIGAKNARGEILLFLDADLRIKRDFLSEAYSEFERRSLDVAISRMKFNSKKMIYSIFAGIYNLVLWILQYIEPNGSCPNGIMLKREVHSKIGGFNESIRFGEDGEYINRAAKNRRFRMLECCIYNNPRRFERKGIINLSLFYLKVAFLQVTGQMSRIYNLGYDFGIYKKK